MDELVEVTQADIEAAHAMVRGWPLAAQMSTYDPQALYQAFARHRIAERERCAKVAEELECVHWECTCSQAASTIAAAIRGDE